MGRLNEPFAHEGVDAPVAGRSRGIGCGHRAALVTCDKIEVAAAEFARGAAGQDQRVTGTAQGCADRPVCFGNMGQGGDDQGWRDGSAGAVRGDVFVVQRILAGDKRGPVEVGGRATSAHRGNQITQRFRTPRVAPRKVVE